MSVEYCPTGEMTSDYFTKPLQGAAFRKFRDRILNLNKQDHETPSTMNKADDAGLNIESKHHRSVLGINDDQKEQRTDEIHESHRSREGKDERVSDDGWKLVRQGK
jgi:hypothetical protein